MVGEHTRGRPARRGPHPGPRRRPDRSRRRRRLHPHRRGLLSELSLGPDDGLPEMCVASFDNLHTLRKGEFRERIAVLSHAKQRELCDVLGAALGCPSG